MHSFDTPELTGLARRYAKGCLICNLGRICNLYYVPFMINLSDRPKPRKTLSLAQRAEVETLLRTGGKTQAEIARTFGVSRKTISRIANPPHERPRAGQGGGAGTSAYLKAPERAALDRLIAEHGYRSRSHVLAHLVRSAAGLATMDAESASVFKEIATQLRGIAVNINQMARAANRGKLAWTEADKAEMQDLARGCGQLSRQVGDMASQSARKVRADRAMGQGDG